MPKSYNIYVRFKDASENNGWGQIIYDSAPTLEYAMEMLNSLGRKSTKLLGKDKGFVITMSIDGSTYDDAEHIHAIATVIDGRSGKLGFITNEGYYPEDVMLLDKFGNISSYIPDHRKTRYFDYYFRDGIKIYNDPIGLWKSRASAIRKDTDRRVVHEAHLCHINLALVRFLSEGHIRDFRREIISHIKKRHDVVEFVGKNYIHVIWGSTWRATDPLSFHDIYERVEMISQHDLLMIIRNTMTPLDVLAKPLLKLV